MIKYLGSKKKLIPEIMRYVDDIRPSSAVDLFSGTSRVGIALKSAGVHVTSNDYSRYAHTLATCYIEADSDRLKAAEKLISDLNRTKGDPGWFTENYCVLAQFFQPKNGARIDAIREAIEAKGLDPEMKAIALTSLMEAADRVDSTCGLQMAYLKRWAPRAHNDLSLRVPALIERRSAKKCRAIHADALDTARSVKADLAYLDPPYNQHSYLGNYHIWESLVAWDKPEVYGKARKRVDTRTKKSPFNSIRAAPEAMRSVIMALDVSYILVSISDEGYISPEAMAEMLSARGYVTGSFTAYQRYVGAKIGIHNLKGEKVGVTKNVTNNEHLLLCKVEKE